MLAREVSPITLDSELCSRCYICHTVCPFEAISLNEDGFPVIDIEKCMVCGICASACPSGIIKPYYYGYDELIKELEAKKTPDTSSLILACRGSTTPDCQALDILTGRNLEKPIIIRVPCVGRLPTEFYLSALSRGIQQIVAIQCNQEFCRFNKGSEMNHRRVAVLQSMLKSLGYADGTVTVIEEAKQIEYDTAKCVGCDKCVHICPYEAIEAQPLSTPKINYEKCTGCGACAVVCPHLALEIGGYECTHLAELIKSYGNRIKEAKKSPAILVFCCQWADFTSLDQYQDGFIEPNIALLEIPCFSKLDPINVFQAFNCGFDGVLAIACLDDDCKSKESRAATEDNMTILSTGLKLMGVENRFKVHKTSPRNLGDFNEQINSFTNAVLALKGE
jgi:coenzyme F420-reducing hydrogenase delta subunit/formate hydrogenlyase subunit 6/NADH:ubiquinone oxidoreductase subunit I